MLCGSALDAYGKFGKRTITVENKEREIQHGMLVNYESLPGAVPRALLPLFGIRQISANWLTHMKIESRSYSKSRGSRHGAFSGDSESKDSRATSQIKKYGKDILHPTFIKLTDISKEALENVMSEEEFGLIKTVSEPGHTIFSSNEKTGGEFIDWSKLSDVPIPHTPRVLVDTSSSTNTDSGTEYLRKHSTPGSVKEYLPSSPFANKHNSKPFKVQYVNCS